MKIIGRGGEVVTPIGYLSSKGLKVSITSFTCSYCVGSIPTCRVGIPVEALRYIPQRATKEIFTVKVGEDERSLETVFTGYISGRAGRINSSRIEAGISLVHQARDMDVMRMLAPGMHTQGADDWSYQRTPTGGGEEIADAIYYSNESDSLPQQLINGVIERLGYWQSQEARTGNEITFKSVGFQAAIDLLSKIRVLNGTLPKELGSQLEDTINTTANNAFENSCNTQSSIWNSFTQIFGDFGLLMICNNKGEVLVSADLANFMPPDGNYFYSDQIYSYDQSSSFGRNVREVVLINQGMRTSLDGVPGEDDDTYTWASWPPNPKEDDAGGTVAIVMPSWLTPLSTLTEEEEVLGPPSPTNPQVKTAESAPSLDKIIHQAQVNLAHRFYNMERDKWNTMSFSGPLVPNAVPGTTVWVQPFSAVRAMSGEEVGDSGLYSGYVAEVQHYVDVQSRSMQTTFVLRNVSEVTEALNITEDPIFSDCQAFVLE